MTKQGRPTTPRASPRVRVLLFPYSPRYREVRPAILGNLEKGEHVERKNERKRTERRKKRTKKRRQVGGKDAKIDEMKGARGGDESRKGMREGGREFYVV